MGTKKLPPDKLLTTVQAGARRGVDGATVRRWCRERLLPSVQVGRDYLIRVADLDAFEPPPRGRPEQKI